MVNRTIAKIFAIMLQYNSKLRIVLQQYVKNIYIFYSPPIFSLQLQFFSLSSFSSLFLHLCSLLSTDPNAISSLSSFYVGSGVQVVGLVFRSWLGCGSDVWIVGDGMGQWWLWVVDRRGCGLWIGVVGSWSWSWIGELG